MKKLILENFRCFRTYQEIPLAPLTLLVGENSTGKSSFLAATRIAWNIGKENSLNFNEEPFLLGSYEQIANYRGGRSGRAKSFTIGYDRSVVDKESQQPVRILSTFYSQGIQPKLEKWSLAFQEYKLEALYAPENNDVQYLIKTPSGIKQLKGDNLEIPLFDTLASILLSLTQALSVNSSQIPEYEMEDLRYIALNIMFSSVNKPYAIAPIRTKPKRTYDPVQDTPQPEGEHVPMVLARIVSSEPKEWLSLKNSLESFGRACGLFENIEVKKQGSSKSSPFQIRVKINGPSTNLVDVGYGVSQVVPILVDSFRSAPQQIILLQQPEVHLHPRGQAELGTFLANLVKHDQKQFVVETHSDYLVDRVCMDVRDGKTLKPEDVLILFFERTDSEVIIHPITVDKNGNIQNAPASYRSFFLKEEQRYLGL